MSEDDNQSGRSWRGLIKLPELMRGLTGSKARIIEIEAIMVPPHVGASDIIDRLIDILSKDPSSLLERLGKATKRISSALEEAATPDYLWTRAAFQEIADLAKTMTARFPHAHFIGVGHSPSYVVYGIESLSRSGGPDVKTSYVPFSRGFVSPRKLNDAKAKGFSLLRSSPLYLASLAYAAEYRKFLEGFGLHPQTIIDNFDKTGQKAVFIDNVQNGGSITSFLYFLHVWAKELGIDAQKFRKAALCVALTDVPIRECFRIPAQDFSFKITAINISTGLRYALNANFSQDSDRFVPFYYPVEWNGPPVNIEGHNRELVAQIKRMIDDTIRGHLQRDAHFILPATPPASLKQQNMKRVLELMEAFDKSGAAAALSATILDKNKKRAKRPGAAAVPEKPAESLKVEEEIKGSASDSPPAPITDETTAGASPPVETAGTQDEPVTFDYNAAAVALIRAYKALNQELSGRHLGLLKSVEGINPQKRAVPIGLAGRNLRQDPAKMLVDAKNYLVRATVQNGKTIVTPENAVAALQNYEGAQPVDIAITDRWLSTLDDKSVADDVGLPEDVVRGARERVINKIVAALQLARR